MNNLSKTMKAPGTFLKPKQLRDFLLAHLNRVYCAKSHLHERLPELADQANFRDLKNAIMETWEDIGRQVALPFHPVSPQSQHAPKLSNKFDITNFFSINLFTWNNCYFFLKPVKAKICLRNS